MPLRWPVVVFIRNLPRSRAFTARARPTWPASEPAMPGTITFAPTRFHVQPQSAANGRGLGPSRRSPSCVVGSEHLGDTRHPGQHVTSHEADCHPHCRYQHELDLGGQRHRSECHHDRGEHQRVDDIGRIGGPCCLAEQRAMCGPPASQPGGEPASRRRRSRRPGARMPSWASRRPSPAPGRLPELVPETPSVPAGRSPPLRPSSRAAGPAPTAGPAATRLRPPARRARTAPRPAATPPAGLLPLLGGRRAGRRDAVVTPEGDAVRRVAARVP
jgi:hypothetical protein